MSIYMSSRVVLHAQQSMSLCVSASLAVLDDGSVWAWGSNTDGQLGTGVELGARGQGTGSESNRRTGMAGQLPGIKTPEGNGAGQEQAALHAAHVCAARKRSGAPDLFRSPFVPC